MKMVDIDVDLDLTFLSIEERQTILNVLKRDEELRNAEDARKKELKNEINQLRQQSAIKVGEVQKSRQCQRCHEELGLIFSRGELCPKCKHLICGNCRTEVTNSTTYQWLCSLCYKQRQLPAVAGDWFYQQLDEKYKHELSSTYGSAVVRSSMRRLQPSDESETLSADNDKLSQSVDRPNPFTGAENGKSTDVPLYQPHGGIEGSVSQMVNEKPSLHNLTVRKVMSRADSSSSDNDSSDDEGKPAKHPNGDVSNGSHSNHENESSSPHKAPLDFNRRTSSSQSEPGELRIGVSQSHTVLRTTQSLNPAELLSPELRARSKSANGSIADEAAADDGTVESLTNIKFRRCSGVGVEEMRRLASMRNSSEDNPDRHSPDGCSPHSSRKGSNSESVGNLAVAADVSDTGASSSAPLIPALSVTDELEITVPLNVTQGKDLADDEDQTCHSDGEVDEFDEEDIDDLFEQAKREKTGGKSKLSSHLTISMESISSMFSDAGTDYHKHPVSGEMQFGLRYDKLTGVLTVTVYQCKELTAVHKKKKTSDPYVKVYLLDAEGQRLKKRKTSVKKSTINPQYGETFRYTLKEADLLSLTMQLSVWNFSRLGHSEFLGEINIPFDTYHFDTARERQWYPLSEKPHMKRHGSELSIISPELKIAIKYTPPIAADTALAKVSKASKQTGGDLHVKVISAQYLPTKKSGVYDPYVKCLLMPERMKHKTGVIKNNLNPVWDEGFTYHKIQAEELCELSLEFAVWDHDRFSSNELLGLVRLNTGKGESFGKACDWMDAVEQECSMWEEMINNPSEWVEHTLPLRDGTVASTSHKTPIQKTLSS